MENDKNNNAEAGKPSLYIITGAGKIGKMGAFTLQETIYNQLQKTDIPKNYTVSFDMELGAEAAKKVKEGIDKLVNALGQAAGEMAKTTQEMKAAAKQAKLYRAAGMEYVRMDRVAILRGKVQEVLFKRDNEMYCWNCDLEGTFCEGARCEYQAETYWEQEKGRTEWKSVIYDALGDEYYNLSLRKKLELLKDLY